MREKYGTDNPFEKMKTAPEMNVETPDVLETSIFSTKYKPKINPFMTEILRDQVGISFE